MSQTNTEYPLFKIETRWKEEAHKSDVETRAVLATLFLIVGFMLLGITSAISFQLIEDSSNALVVMLSAWIAIIVVAIISMLVLFAVSKTKPTTVKTFDWWGQYKTGDTLVDDIVNSTVEIFGTDERMSMDQVEIIDCLIHGYNLSRASKTPQYGAKEALGQKLYTLVTEASILPQPLHSRQPL